MGQSNKFLIKHLLYCSFGKSDMAAKTLIMMKSFFFSFEISNCAFDNYFQVDEETDFYFF